MSSVKRYLPQHHNFRFLLVLLAFISYPSFNSTLTWVALDSCIGWTLVQTKWWCPDQRKKVNNYFLRIKRIRDFRLKIKKQRCALYTNNNGPYRVLEFTNDINLIKSSCFDLITHFISFVTSIYLFLRIPFHFSTFPIYASSLFYNYFRWKNLKNNDNTFGKW